MSDNPADPTREPTFRDIMGFFVSSYQPSSGQMPELDNDNDNDNVGGGGHEDKEDKQA